MNLFSWQRFSAMLYKEFIQMSRDRLTLAMMMILPLMELILFGYAINANPKYLPTALLSAENTQFTRTFVHGLENTDYFRFTRMPHSEQEGQKMLAEGDVLFLLHIPPDFTRRLIRNQHPQLLIEADATDPVTTVNALMSVQALKQHVFDSMLIGNLAPLKKSNSDLFDIVTHAKYNPESITQYNIVPGLLGVVLTMTMVIITSMAITRERERGTFEHLLATPAKPLEVMLGKIVPYIIVGYFQMLLILFFAFVLFHVPMQGSIVLLVVLAFPFIAANLAVGLMFSSLVKTQIQSVQMAIFFFLPSLLLSGFMFPFNGMPRWAQWVGQLLPLTHFLRIIRGIMLKGNTFTLVWSEVWPILVFIVVVIAASVKRYHRTLD